MDEWDAQRVGWSDVQMASRELDVQMDAWLDVHVAAWSELS